MSAGPRDVAVVTGGAGAIGAAVCHRLAAAGRQVVVVDLDAAAAQDVAASLTATATRGVGLDVADTDAVAAAIGKVAVDVGPVGTLINVAGWDRFVPFVDTTPGVLGPGHRHQLPRHAQHRARGAARDDRAAAWPDRVGRLGRGPGRILVGGRSTPGPRGR